MRFNSYAILYNVDCIEYLKSDQFMNDIDVLGGGGVKSVHRN